MSAGMLLFTLFDSTLITIIVFSLLKALFKGKKIGIILGTVFGVIFFAGYVGLFVWINTAGHFMREDLVALIYYGPIVLFVLLTILIIVTRMHRKSQHKLDNIVKDEHDEEALEDNDK